MLALSPLLLMALSGFAALGYQIVWTQQSALWLGHETVAILAVVAAFFGGIGLGSLALARRIDASPRPARWYAACEVAIALWSIVLAVAMGPASQALIGTLGPQPTPSWHACVVFIGTFVMLLPATAAMGATLPAMERIVASHAGHARRAPIASLYASNTVGAVAGVLGAAFVLVPMVGLAATAALCAAANLGCALLAWRLYDGAPVAAAPRDGRPAKLPLALLAATGFLGIGYEVLVVRVLSQLTQNTVYTFAILLAVYLVGTAGGAALYARAPAARTPNDTARTRDRLLCAVSAACLAGIAALALAPRAAAALNGFARPGFGLALAAEALLAVLAFLPATIAMGALFSHLASSARAAGTSFGHALGVNTSAAALAPPVFGFALPVTGATPALLAVAAGYLLAASARAWKSLPQLATIAAAAALAIRAPTLAHVDVPPGGRVLSRVEGAGATVSVLESQGVRTLHINNRQQEGSSATWFADARQAVLPLRLHPSPRTALFLGIGTGATARAAAELPGLRVDAVELLPEVVAATRWFAPPTQANPRLHVLVADARRFVRTASHVYDVIVADNFHPARSGSASLYTVEHFEAVRARLAPGGVFCQWLPLHQLDLVTLGSIVRSFQHAYPESWALLATHSLDTPVLGLIAHRGGRFAGTNHQWSAPPALAALGLDEMAVLGSFVAGPAALTRFARGAPLNTDDSPAVAYLAPRLTYAADSTPRERLLALLRGLSLSPEELLAGPDAARWSPRLTAYWAARNRYLEIGSTVRPSADVEAMLAQVREPLLEVLGISAEFVPAYDPLLRMATELAHRDADAGRALLTRLARIQPGRRETIEALRALDTPASGRDAL